MIKIQNSRIAVLALIGLLFAGTLCKQMPGQAESQETSSYDVVVYGGSSAGVTAAVQAARMGKSVVLVSPREHLGGLSSSGLGMTDTGSTGGIGGLSREFYERVKSRYDQSSAWQYEAPSDYRHYREDNDVIWRFEPSVAENVFDTMVEEAGVTVLRGQRLNRKDGVGMSNGTIQSIETRSGTIITGDVFIDATYVGDLMAAAGVTYTVGREPNDKYGEEFNGVQKDVRHHRHFFFGNVSPYVEPGNPESGLVPRVHGNDPGEDGEGDHRVQAYNFRLCMTDVEKNQVAWPKPEGYDPDQYELLLRAFENDAIKGGNSLHSVAKMDMMPNRKTDTNNRGPFSTDNIGKNYAFPEASYEKRREIYREHERYQKGFFWTLAHHPRVPEKVRKQTQKWGLAADEFEDNGHWPYMLYIREGRRMVGQYVMTEKDCLRIKDTPKSVGLGSYTMDSHNVQRYVTEDGYVQNEGDIGVHPGGPYEIAYGSLVPKEDEVQNLLVPVAVSASHIAFGSIRMEPVFMILGQSAGTAAVHAIQEEVAVQNVDYARLKERLKEDGQRLYTDVAPKYIRTLTRDLFSGTVLDDPDARAKGDWTTSSSVNPHLGNGYLHDGNEKKGKNELVFETDLPAGKYEVRLGYTPHSNRANNVPVEIYHADGTETVHVDQTKPPEHHKVFEPLTTLRFDGSGRVVVSTGGTSGYVVVDAVQFVKVE